LTLQNVVDYTLAAQRVLPANTTSTVDTFDTFISQEGASTSLGVVRPGDESVSPAFYDAVATHVKGGFCATLLPPSHADGPVEVQVPPGSTNHSFVYPIPDRNGGSLPGHCWFPTDGDLKLAASEDLVFFRIKPTIYGMRLLETAISTAGLVALLMLLIMTIYYRCVIYVIFGPAAGTKV
jgi:hypothetical protein